MRIDGHEGFHPSEVVGGLRIPEITIQEELRARAEGVAFRGNVRRPEGIRFVDYCVTVRWFYSEQLAQLVRAYVYTRAVDARGVSPLQEPNDVAFYVSDVTID